MGDVAVRDKPSKEYIAVAVIFVLGSNHLKWRIYREGMAAKLVPGGGFLVHGRGHPDRGDENYCSRRRARPGFMILLDS